MKKTCKTCCWFHELENKTWTSMDGVSVPVFFCNALPPADKIVYTTPDNPACMYFKEIRRGVKSEQV